MNDHQPLIPAAPFDDIRKLLTGLPPADESAVSIVRARDASLGSSASPAS